MRSTHFAAWCYVIFVPSKRCEFVRISFFRVFSSIDLRTVLRRKRPERRGRKGGGRRSVWGQNEFGTIRADFGIPKPEKIRVKTPTRGAPLSSDPTEVHACSKKQCQKPYQVIIDFFFFLIKRIQYKYSVRTIRFTSKARVQGRELLLILRCKLFILGRTLWPRLKTAILYYKKKKKKTSK